MYDKRDRLRDVLEAAVAAELSIDLTDRFGCYQAAVAAGKVAEKWEEHASEAIPRTPVEVAAHALHQQYKAIAIADEAEEAARVVLGA